MLPEWVMGELKNSGGFGAVIFVLLMVIAFLANIIRGLHKNSWKIQEARVGERDVLNKALSDNNNVIALLNKVTEHRNEVTDELADAIKTQMMAFERLNDRIDMQTTTLRDEINRNGAAQLSSAQVYSKTVDDIRNFLVNTRPAGRAR